MLDQLVESRTGGAGNSGSRNILFLATTLVLVGTMAYAMYYSLFNKDYGLGSGDLELSNLVAPVPVAEEEPPPPEPEQPKDQPKAAPNVDVRTEIIQRMDESPKVPDKTSSEKLTVPPPRKGLAAVLGSKNSDSENTAPSSYKGPGNTEGTGLKGGTGDSNEGDNEGGNKPVPPPPPPAQKPPPVVPKKISGGVLNGKATSLPKPVYPAAARAVRASGAVNVQVTINESGAVVSASAVSGPALLRPAAVAAARSARFAPTLLSGQPVSVTGVIVYNFVP